MSDSAVPSRAVEADVRNDRIRQVGRRQGFSPYPKYRPSGVEWLGDVPEHWDVKSLGTFGYFFKGSGGTRSDRSPTGVPCIRYGDIYTSYDHHVRTSFGFVSEQESEGYTRISYGDVLFAGSGETLDEIGKSVTNLLGEHTCCGGDVIIFRSAPRVLDPVFSGYALHCAHASWQKSCMGRGVTVMHIYASELKHLVIPFPVRQEQEAIGAFLDRETAKIDALIAQNEALIEHLKEQRAALISRTVTRGLPPDESRKAGIDPNPKLKPSGVEWPSRVPEHWTVKRLKYVARRPIENGINEAGIHDDPEWPRYIRITDIKTPRSLRHDTFRSLPPEKAAQAFVDPYDILLARVGEPGISYLHAPHDGTRACFAGYLVRYSPDAEHVVPGFAAYWTESHVYWACVRSRVIQTTIQNFSATRYKNLPMPLPPLAEQKAIVLYLDQETTKIDKATTLAQQEADLLREYRPRLISDVVTGKVDVRCLGGAAVEAAV